MLEGPGKKPFTQMYNTLKPGLFESGQHVRGGKEGGNWVYYTHDPLMPSSPFDGNAAEERRKEKYDNGAKIVRDALKKEYGEAAAKSVLSSVRAKVKETTGRDLKNEVTRGDLVLIHQELQQQQYRVLTHPELQVQDQEGPHQVLQPQDQELQREQQKLQREQQKLQRQRQELQMLQSRVANDSANVIKDDLAAGRASMIGKYYGPNGAGKVELLQNYMQRYTVQFDSENGTLTLTQGGGHVGKEEGENLADLTKFIDRYFNVKPPDPAFRNITGNILLYLPLGTSPSMDRKMQRVVDGRLSPFTAGDVVWSTFTLSVRKDENGNPPSVSVASDTCAPYTRKAQRPVGPVDFSKYRYLRKEAFEISGAQLRSDPPAFDAKANLFPVGRSDTIELAGRRIGLPAAAASASPGSGRT